MINNVKGVIIEVNKKKEGVMNVKISKMIQLYEDNKLDDVIEDMNIILTRDSWHYVTETEKCRKPEIEYFIESHIQTDKCISS